MFWHAFLVDRRITVGRAAAVPIWNIGLKLAREREREIPQVVVVLQIDM